MSDEKTYNDTRERFGLSHYDLYQLERKRRIDLFDQLTQAKAKLDGIVSELREMLKRCKEGNCTTIAPRAIEQILTQHSDGTE